MITIKVLGPGCANCRKLEDIARQALAETGVEGRIVKITDMQEIVAHDVMATPGLWIEGRLVSSGRIPAPAAVAGWIREAAV